jgi:hypothetical protein
VIGLARRGSEEQGGAPVSLHRIVDRVVAEFVESILSTLARANLDELVPASKRKALEAPPPPARKQLAAKKRPAKKQAKRAVVRKPQKIDPARRGRIVEDQLRRAFRTGAVLTDDDVFAVAQIGPGDLGHARQALDRLIESGEIGATGEGESRMFFLARRGAKAPAARTQPAATAPAAEAAPAPAPAAAPPQPPEPPPPPPAPWRPTVIRRKKLVPPA